jgi:ABC-2 type transport system permease protein
MLLSDHISRYWSVVEKNTQLFSWSGAFLYNRLVWLAVGLVSLASAFFFFPMSAEELTRKRSVRKAKRLEAAAQEEVNVRPTLGKRLPQVAQIFGAATTRLQFFSLTRLYFLNVIREVPFWAICLITVILAFINGREAGHFRDGNVWPVTYLVVMTATYNGIFWYAIATLYAGELVWRDRDVHFDQIRDALPVSTTLNWLSKLTAMAGAEMILFLMLMLCDIVVQTSLGYYRYELGHYFQELFLIWFTQLLAFTLYAFFWQTIVPNKFLGHFIVIGTTLIVPVLYQYGFENRLYLIFESTPYTYSDMNGYGHFVSASFWSIFIGFVLAGSWQLFLLC